MIRVYSVANTTPATLEYVANWLRKEGIDPNPIREVMIDEETRQARITDIRGGSTTLELRRLPAFVTPPGVAPCGHAAEDQYMRQTCLACDRNRPRHYRGAA